MRYEWEVNGCILFIPGSNYGDWNKERSQPNHREGKSIHTDTPVNSEGFDPFISVFKVKRAEIQQLPFFHTSHLGKEHHGGDTEHNERYDKRYHTNGGAHLFSISIGKVSNEHEEHNTADER